MTKFTAVAVIAASLTLSGCHHEFGNVGSASANIPADPAQIGSVMLARYEATEFEPGWTFKLRNNAYEMTYLDLVNGQNVVTHTGAITSQTSLTGGQDWLLQGSGGGQSITVMIDQNLTGCTHSASGDLYRDDVMVAHGGRLWVGCGGPIQ